MKIVWCSIFCFISWSLAYGQDRIEELTKRIEELEQQQQDFFLQSSERNTQVRSFLKDNLTFGGFFEPSYTILYGPDTQSQATNSANILGINLAADFKSNLRFVSQFITALGYSLENQHNNPQAGASGQPEQREFRSPVFGTLLTQGYLEYSFKNYRLQGGTGYVPFGFAHQQRELVLFIRRGGPQLLRTAELLSPLWSGINFLANFPLSDSSWGYSIHTVTPVTGPKNPGLGGRIFWSSSGEKFTGGLSTQMGKIGAKNYETLGTDIRIDVFNMRIVGEYAHAFFDEDDDPWSAYLEPAVYIWKEEVLFYLFGDYSYSPRNEVGAGMLSQRDPIQKWEYGFGFNWLPTSFTRLRLGIIFNDYVGGQSVINGQERDYTSIDLSAGVAF